MSRLPDDIGELLDTDPIALGDRCMAAEADRDRFREAIERHRERTQSDPYWESQNPYPADESLWAALGDKP